MKYDEFLARVRERGEYADRDEAAGATKAVLEVLAGRMSAKEVGDMAAQLPAPLDEIMTAVSGGGVESYGVEEFCHRVAERTGAHDRTAQWDASAVLTTLADTVSPGELNQIISQLPSGYAVLFGKADLSD
ncbi:DUF2267 domain-containing protein [Streptomyces sp. NPDC003077]|uniref:DUF2267 domain-containing protein n=1 Tax=Streptomyces sp. NPDC003077 TaxID=3154443 RepID=UPI0033BA4856